jgi:hypothetical protein
MQFHVLPLQSWISLLLPGTQLLEQRFCRAALDAGVAAKRRTPRAITIDFKLNNIFLWGRKLRVGGSAKKEEGL